MNAANLASSPPIRVVTVDDHAQFRESLQFVLDNSDGFQCVGAFPHAEAALEKTPALKPDVVLIDLHLPRLSGSECIRRLKEAVPDTSIVVLTVEESPGEVVRAFKAGAVGYLVKHESIGNVLDAVREVYHGGAPMSPSIARLVIRACQEPQAERKNDHELTGREKAILDAIVQGLHRKQVAEKFEISERTVGSHLRHIYRKLHVNSLAHAVIKYVNRNTA